MALLALNGAAISLSVTDLPIVVQDLDNTPTSRQYIDSFRSSLTFRIVELPVADQPETALLENNARGAIIIPEHFERDIKRGVNTEVQFLVDASDANSANIMRGSASTITQAFVATMRPPNVHNVVPIQPHVRLWFNPGRQSSVNIAPSMLAVGLSLFPPLLAALAMSREGEQKTILQVYVSSITAWEYLLGKVSAYMVIAIAEWFLCLVLTIWMFGLRIVGDPTPFLVCTVLCLFATVSFGVMVGAAIPDQAAAIQATQLAGFLLSYLLSGAIFPLANIPAGIRWVSYAIPARYYIEVVRDALVRGGGWAGVWDAPIALSIIGSVFFSVAWLRMRKMEVSA